MSVPHGHLYVLIYSNTLGNVIITNNTIKGNSIFTGYINDGIYVPSAKSITLTNNIITGNYGSDVIVISNSVALTNNTIMGNYSSGLYVYVDIDSDEACSMNFTNNTIKGNWRGVS
jgi:parallel beta-helix repeat protein